MIIKTTLIAAFMVLTLITIGIGNVNVGMQNSNLKSKLQNGGFLKPVILLKANDSANIEGEDNV